jgi:signal transduction histidine kinase
MEKMEAEIYSRSRQLEEMNRQRLEAIGRLAGGVAHDFNNLLGVILGYSRLLAERLPENGSFRGGLEKIEHAAESAASLTRQLLAFSRRQILEPKVIDLNQVVADVEPLIRRVIGADITFGNEPRIVTLECEGRPAQVEQVIMNLALNARDAMPDGGRLVIETSKAEIDEIYSEASYCASRTLHNVVSGRYRLWNSPRGTGSHL